MYVVKKGRKPWIYLHWLDAYRQIRGLKNVEFASFSYWTNIPDYDITGAPEEGGFAFALKEAEDYFFGENKPEKMPDWFFEYEDEFEDIDDFDEFSKEETSEIEEQEDEYAYQEPSYPAFEMEENEKQKINETPMFELAELGIALSASIVGQDSAIKKMENAYFNLLRRELMNEKNKGPRGVFLFAGPPGVGKTYMAQLFAEFHQEKFRRFDMSGYSHDGSVVGIVGLDGQYKGARPGEFTNFVKNNPNGIVLFDEIEKAHPDVIRLFLRVLDEGVCIDECDKEEIDCSGCTIIFTTNAGKQLYVDANDENLTELPDSRKQRYIQEFNLPEYDANIITGSKMLADLFDEASKNSNNPKSISNWIMGDLIRLLGEKELDKVPFTGKDLASLVELIDSGKISSAIPKKVFEEMFETGKEPEVIVNEKGLVQISDEGAIKEIVMKVLENNPQSIADFKAGKDKALGFLVGQAMKESKGKANPQMLNKMFLEELNK